MTFSESLQNLVKSLAWLGAGLLWEAIGLRYVSDTPAGASVLLIPTLLMVGISTYFFLRSRGIFRRDDDDGTR
jgi:hypothetical protein